MLDARRLDFLGLVLLASLLAWVFVAAGPGASPVPLAAAVGTAGVAVVAGRLMARRLRWLGPAVIAVVAGAVLVAAPSSGAVGEAPGGGALGYANATGAFSVQALIAALMVVVLVGQTWARLVALSAAIAFAAVPFVVGSSTAAVIAVAVPGLALAMRWSWGARAAILLCALMVGGVVVSTIAVAASPADGGLRTLVGDVLTERRTDLWADAWRLALEHPVAGIGPGRFVQESPVARSDPDARAAHNEFLQVAAEVGFVGLALFGLAFAWGFVRLLASAEPDAMTVLGAASLAAVGIHASVDFVLRFPLVLVIAAALVGAAQAEPNGSERLASWERSGAATAAKSSEEVVGR